MEKKYLKDGLVILGLIAIPWTLQAQTWDEWFHQNKTQLKYLHQQIAALVVYAGYLEKGYAIVKEGTTFISDLKNGEFNLHKDYFHSLSLVPGAVKTYADVGKINNASSKIIALAGICKNLATQSVPTTFSEALRSTADGALEQDKAYIAELGSLLTDGQWQLKENERINRINAINESLRRLLQFMLKTTRDASLVIAAQQKEKEDVDLMQRLYDVNP